MPTLVITALRTPKQDWPDLRPTCSTQGVVGLATVWDLIWKNKVTREGTRYFLLLFILHKSAERHSCALQKRL